MLFSSGVQGQTIALIEFTPGLSELYTEMTNLRLKRLQRKIKLSLSIIKIFENYVSNYTKLGMVSPQKLGDQFFRNLNIHRKILLMYTLQRGELNNRQFGLQNLGFYSFEIKKVFFFYTRIIVIQLYYASFIMPLSVLLRCRIVLLFKHWEALKK